MVYFAGLRGRCCLILGGRPSAFVWPAPAEAVLHGANVGGLPTTTPESTASDWSFVDDLLACNRQTRGWFRGPPEAERAA